MASFQFKMQGFPAANRDATIELVHESSGKKVERKPFLDGSLTVADLDDGYYQMKVIHPNLVNPIVQKRIRLFPQKAPTVVPIPIPEDLFRDSPIRDIPDADLTPVQQSAAAIKTQLAPLGQKTPGEAIKSVDWNMLVNGVAGLAVAVGQLCELVAPRGHDHPEIADKIAEVQGNIKRFTEAFGKSLVELQREIETRNLESQVNEVLDKAEAPQEMRDRVTARVDELKGLIQSDTLHFTNKLANAGSYLLSEINTMATAKGDKAGEFLEQPSVKATIAVASQYSDTGSVATSEQEIATYRKTTAAVGGKMGSITKGAGGR
jgi:hypothetical protein